MAKNARDFLLRDWEMPRRPAGSASARAERACCCACLPISQKKGEEDEEPYALSMPFTQDAKKKRREIDGKEGTVRLGAKNAAVALFLEHRELVLRLVSRIERDLMLFVPLGE